MKGRDNGRMKREGVGVSKKRWEFAGTQWDGMVFKLIGNGERGKEGDGTMEGERKDLQFNV